MRCYSDDKVRPLGSDKAFYLTTGRLWLVDDLVNRTQSVFLFLSGAWPGDVERWRGHISHFLCD